MTDTKIPTIKKERPPVVYCSKCDSYSSCGSVAFCLKKNRLLLGEGHCRCSEFKAKEDNQ